MPNSIEAIAMPNDGDYDTHAVTARFDGHVYMLRFKTDQAVAAMDAIVAWSEGGAITCQRARTMISVVKSEAVAGLDRRRQWHSQRWREAQRRILWCYYAIFLCFSYWFYLALLEIFRTLSP